MYPALLRVSGSPSLAPSTMYSTSHLFFLGDLNFRVSLPAVHSMAGPANWPRLAAALSTHEGREEIKEFDQLLIERRKSNTLYGLREGNFWAFKCSYKYKIGEVDHYRYLSPLPDFNSRY